MLPPSGGLRNPIFPLTAPGWTAHSWTSHLTTLEGSVAAASQGQIPQPLLMVNASGCIATSLYEYKQLYKCK